MPTEQEILEAKLAELNARRARVENDKERQEAKVEADDAEIERIDYYRNAIQVRLDQLP